MPGRRVRGTVVTTDGKLDSGRIGIRDGRIVAIGQSEAREAEDDGSLLILPSPVDGRTHARDFGGLPGIAQATAMARSRSVARRT